MKTCAQPGCPVLVRKGRCQEHDREQDQARGGATERGYDTRWAAYSRRFRAAHPICGEQADGTLDPTHSKCLQAGRLTPVGPTNGKALGCVDHIVPASRGGAFWDPTNHQSLCLACNSAKGDR